MPQSSETSIIPFFLLAALITLPTGAVVGADHNHLLMPGLAVAAGVGALAAYLLGRLTSEEVEVRQAMQGAGGVPTASIPWVRWRRCCWRVISCLPPSRRHGTTPTCKCPQHSNRNNCARSWKTYQNPGTIFFSDDPGVLALAGKITPYDDPFTMAALAPQNRWDETSFRDQLRAGKFALLILSCDVTTENSCRGDTFTPGVLDAIRDGYDLLFRDVLFTYAPKK